jgi:hypothetical protein
MRCYGSKEWILHGVCMFSELMRGPVEVERSMVSRFTVHG